ncbi:MAG: hypothetical protein P8J68_09345 [Arenicellaceae bacterium]|nr:hypothetical protein [Arenicellaceae bacterium]
MSESTVFELNDACLRWVAGEHAVESIGIALVEGDGSVLFGDAAVAQSYLRPTQISSEYWHRLDTQPIKAKAGKIQHHADLVYAHLMQLKNSSNSDAKVDVIVPSSTSEAQLSMLLGVAQHAKLDIGRVVGRAVLETAAVSGSFESVIHLEMTLHQCVVSRVFKQEGYWEVSEVKSVSGAGYLSFLESWSRGAAELFVKETRFDPLHDGHSEQTLIDLLNKSFAGGELHNGLTIELSGRRLEVSDMQIQGWGAAPLGRIAKAIEELKSAVAAGLSEDLKSHQILCSGLIAEIPGVRSAISEFDRVELHHQWLDELLEPATDGGVHITNILARGTTPLEQELVDNSKANPKVSTESDSPTHLLIGSIAHSLSAKNVLKAENGELIFEPVSQGVDLANQMCAITCDTEDFAGYQLAGVLDGVLLNEETAGTEELQSGDQLNINGLTATLIRVF